MDKTKKELQTELEEQQKISELALKEIERLHQYTIKNFHRTLIKKIRKQRNTTKRKPEKTLIPPQHLNSKKADITLIIPNYNNTKYLHNLLMSLKETNAGKPYQILIADDCSENENTKIYLQTLAKQKNVLVHTNKTNVGYTKTINQAAEQTHSKYIVIMNNDLKVTNNWLHLLMKAFENENVGLAGCQLYNYNKIIPQETKTTINEKTQLTTIHRTPLTEIEETAYCSACFAIETKYFKSLGKFDERYGRAYYEDVDLATKVKNDNKLVVNTLAKVYHKKNATHNTYKRHSNYIENKAKYLYKWNKKTQ